MRRIKEQSRFRADLRRVKRRGANIEELIAVVEMLAQDGELPAAYQPHRLTGEWKGVWECHIEPDWLLIYEINALEVLLIRTGTHRDLFR